MRLSSILALPILSFATFATAQEPASNSDVLFILDGSGSMWGRVNDVEKIVVAKDVMNGLIEGLPPEIDAGLITYGHRVRGACDDIELIATPGETARGDLLAALSGVNPLGKTPISGSLLRAGEVLRQTEDPVSIVLVSDGIESCEGDPCATAAFLREQDIDVRIHVVGFDVDAEAEEQLSCIADVGGGEYYQAGSADALTDALANVRTSIIAEPVVVAPKPEPVAVDPNIRLAEDVIGGVNVIDAETEEVLLRLAGLIEREVPAGSYKFGFDNFLSPVLPIEEGQDYVISAEQFGLSVIRIDGTQTQNVDVIDTATGEKITFLSGTLPELFAPGAYLFEFANFTSPPVTIEPNAAYVISPSDYALASIAMDGTQLKNVQIIDDATGERVTQLSGAREARIPPGTYRFEFANFETPALVVEGGGSYVISPSDYGLATVAMDGAQIKNVALVNAASGETTTSLSGKTPKLVPPGTYHLKFSDFTSPPFIVEKNRSHTFSPLDYGLARIALDGTQDGGVNVIGAQDGKRITRFSGTSQHLVPPGEYVFGFDNFTSPPLTIEPGSAHVISAEAYGLGTVQLSERVQTSFLLLQVGQEPIEIRDGRVHQIGPGPYAQVYQNKALGIIQIAPNGTLVIEIE